MVEYDCFIGANMELKSCPFCGSENVGKSIHKIHTSDDTQHITYLSGWVGCYECSAGTTIRKYEEVDYRVLENELIESWNRRA